MENTVVKFYDTGEDILDTAKRELYEETGATEYSILWKICRPGGHIR